MQCVHEKGAAFCTYAFYILNSSRVKMNYFEFWFHTANNVYQELYIPANNSFLPKMSLMHSAHETIDIQTRMIVTQITKICCAVLFFKVCKALFF